MWKKHELLVMKFFHGMPCMVITAGLVFGYMYLVSLPTTINLFLNWQLKHSTTNTLLLQHHFFTQHNYYLLWHSENVLIHFSESIMIQVLASMPAATAAVLSIKMEALI